jgi:predicted RNA-binding Zn ribbon-like protein
VSRIGPREPAAPRVVARLSRTDLLWVANTAHGSGGHWHARAHAGAADHDHLATPEGAVRYLADHRVAVPRALPDQAALSRLRAIRAAVARLAEPDGDPWTADAVGMLAGARYALAPDGRLSSPAEEWRGFCDDLLLPLVDLAVSGTVLRRCANPACRLLFEDGSRSHSRRWCDSAACGNRDRVRRARSGAARSATSSADTP